MLPRFQHILVPVDFTEKNLTALDLVFDLAVAFADLGHAELSSVGLVPVSGTAGQVRIETCFYWGQPPEELSRSKTIQDARLLDWLDFFVNRRAILTPHE